MDPVVIALAAAFAAGTLLLLNSDTERHVGVFFIIRSGYGIKLIDSLAKFKPRVWNFIADFSVLLSFGGMGAYYLSTSEETKPNLYMGIPLLGLLLSAAAFFTGETSAALLLAIAALASYPLLSAVRNTAANFMYTALLLASTSQLFINGFAAAAFGFLGLPALMVSVMVSHGLNILSAETTLPGVSPLLPSTQEGNVGVSFPGYGIFIPWWYALIALATTLVSHEAAHGVLTRVAGVRLKSTGILSALALPIGAFVEPDEDELKKKSSVQRMRVYTMGSFANLAVGLLSVLLIIASTLFFANTVHSNGLSVVGHMEGFPAEDVVPVDSIIYSVNGTPTPRFDVFKNLTAGLKPGGTVSLNTSEGVYDITLAAGEEEPERGYIGIYLMENLEFSGPASGFINVGLLSFVINALSWIAFFNVNIALVNLLPVIPFDGGRMFKEVVSTMNLSEGGVNRIVYAVVAFTALIFLVNLIPLLSMLAELFLNLV